jgi:glycosyltransferase involved in cell wall biosynthesis
MNPDVSVIIPSRDRLWSLPQCVASCRSSKISVEIIVIDDASTDGTGDWLKTQKDVVVVEGAGWGKPWGVTKALSIARGTFVRFLDSDDWLNEGANEEQFALGERASADLVVSGYDLYQDLTMMERLPWRPTDDFISRQLGEDLSNGSHYSAFLFRRSFVQGIPHRTLFPAADFASRDDRCYVLEVAVRQPVIAVYEGTALCHRRHEKPRLQFQSGLRSVGTNIQHLVIYRQILALLARAGELTTRRRRAAVNALWPLATWIGYSHVDDAAELYDWIRELEPDFVPPEKGILGVFYRNLGFRRTQRLLHWRRALVSRFRART